MAANPQTQKTSAPRPAMGPGPSQPATRPLTPESLSGELATLLGGLTSAYRDLLAKIAEQRDAIRRADPHAVQFTVDQQRGIIERIASLEENRRTLVDRAIATFRLVNPVKGMPVTLGVVASAAPAADRERLLKTAAELRELMARVQDEGKTVATATRSILTHLEGLVRQVGRRLSHAGTYSSRGYVEAGGVVVSAVDVRS